MPTIKAKKPIAKECEDCGEDIELARLKKVPDATRCVDCQNIHESENGISLTVSITSIHIVIGSE